MSAVRARRTRADMETIREALHRVLAADHPQTVRQVFYRLTTEGVVGKTEVEYKHTVGRLLTEMRRSGEIPYEWLADSTRWMRKPRTFSSVEEALRNTAETYRRALWCDSPDRVEVWLEKEALAGVLIDVTHPWDVPLMVTRGYGSISFLHSAAIQIVARSQQGQRTCIYYLGDRDPSGVDIDRAIVEGIGCSICSLMGLVPQGKKEELGEEFTTAFTDLATFERIAVTEAQMEELALPSRPTKKSDSRSKNFTGRSVEVDSIPAQTLRQIAEEAIECHVDSHRLGVLETVEDEERRELTKIAEMLS